MTFRLLGSYQKRPVIGCALSYRVGQSFQPQGAERELPPGARVHMCYYYSFCGSLISLSLSPELTQAWLTECGEWRAHEREMKGEIVSEAY